MFSKKITLEYKSAKQFALRGQSNVFSDLSKRNFKKAKNIALTPLFIFLIFLSTHLKAGPWIPVGDPWLRADIEYLADTGIIKSPITTWPLMWSNIKQDMDIALRPNEFDKLSEQQQNALLRIRSEFRKATESSQSMGVELASDPEVLRGFANTPREESSVFVQRQAMTDDWAYNLNMSYVHDPYIAPGQSEENVRFDGSYVTGIYGNVALGVGWIDKWWGPGWDSSLILSNNARPRPGIFVQRNYAEPFESEWLSWMGPWTFQAFASVLDDNRVINDAKLLGLSISFKPLDSLEISLRRTAQWGGDGRPENLDAFVDMFLGRDNCGDNGIDDCGTNNSNEPGNQLGAIDFKWRVPVAMPINVYMQIMGEDEAGYLPSKKTYLYGVSLLSDISDMQVRTFIEHINTSIDYLQRFNITYSEAYNHSLYRTGYRYYGRSLAASIDNDSEMIDIGSILQIDNDNKLLLQVRAFKLNFDSAGFNPLSSTAVESIEILALYEYINNRNRIRIELSNLSKIIDNINLSREKLTASISWRYQF